MQHRRKEPTVTQAINVGTAQETNLLRQQGPSCWLFVVEALARSKSHLTTLDTRSLQIVMYCYPDSEKVTAAHEAQTGTDKVSRRTIALKLVVANVDAMLAALKEFTDRAAKLGGGTQYNIGLDASKRLARRAMDSDASISFFTFEGDDDSSHIDARTLAADFTKARKVAAGLYGLAVKSGDKDEAAALLNTGAQMIAHDSEIPDVKIMLEIQDKPSYMGINMRYRQTDQERLGAGPVDFTGRPLSGLTDSAHAILLIGYDKSTGIATYKDPNHGNKLFKVTAEQVRGMAGTGDVDLRAFFVSSSKRSALAEVLAG
jgi:hypothetical protein